MRREGRDIARCTVQRLMRSLGIRGVVRGKKVITTNPDTSLRCPNGKVNRLFKADRPNKLWGEPFCAIGSITMASDFTSVPTWSETVKGLTPYEFIGKQWAIEPERFTLNPIHQMPGLNRSIHV